MKNTSGFFGLAAGTASGFSLFPATTGAAGFAALTSFFGTLATASSGVEESDRSISEDSGSGSFTFLTAAFTSAFSTALATGFF